MYEYDYIYNVAKCVLINGNDNNNNSKSNTYIHVHSRNVAKKCTSECTLHMLCIMHMDWWINICVYVMYIDI